MLPQSLSEQPVGIALPQICRNKLLGVPIENLCVKGGGLLYGGNSAVPTRIVGTENWFPIGCSDKFVGPTVPTKIVGTANGGFLLAVPTNLSEQYTFYNAA